MPLPPREVEIRMSEPQRRRITHAFESAPHPTAHRAVWSRRSYAPMHIHAPEFEGLRSQLRGALPDHEIAFDVIFESKGTHVEWHCDYESLGPFEVPNRWRAVRDGHFVTVHFNLTEDGGTLVTLPWVWPSYLFYLAIVHCGIFSWAHAALVWLFWPVFACCAWRHPNTPLVGNVFDNTRLHMVTAGAPRLSYVVRLVRRGRCVGISRRSIAAGEARSDACSAFRRVADVLPASDATVDAAAVDWASVAGG